MNKILPAHIILSVVCIIFMRTNCCAQDPNLHIYLSFGQSNMEGQGAIEKKDEAVDSRFLVMQALDCPALGRKKMNWYTAKPPLCQCYSKLGPIDYFGKTMVSTLPDSIRVGVINVSVAGCDIRLFDKDLYQEYDSTYSGAWFLDKVKGYKGHPYEYLIDLAKHAQKDGVIKGILLHQGESNMGDSNWPQYVKKIYHDMLTHLGLDSKDVPLLVGELASQNNSCCSSMNKIINELPNEIMNSHVVSSKNCTTQDNAHFNPEGYRELGRRYATKMLYLLETKNRN